MIDYVKNFTLKNTNNKPHTFDVAVVKGGNTRWVAKKEKFSDHESLSQMVSGFQMAHQPDTIIIQEYIPNGSGIVRGETKVIPGVSAMPGLAGPSSDHLAIPHFGKDFEALFLQKLENECQRLSTEVSDKQKIIDELREKNSELKRRLDKKKMKLVETLNGPAPESTVDQAVKICNALAPSGVPEAIIERMVGLFEKHGGGMSGFNNPQVKEIAGWLDQQPPEIVGHVLAFCNKIVDQQAKGQTTKTVEMNNSSNLATAQ